MKKVFLALLAVFSLLLSCESLQGERTCTITAPDGTVYRFNPGVACETPSESTTGFVFETSGKKLEDRYSSTATWRLRDSSKQEDARISTRLHHI